MLPIRLVETERDDFEGPIVELWRSDTFVGMVFWDGEAAILQVYPEEGGDVHDLDIAELQTLLDAAVRIVDPDAFDREMGELRAATGDAAWGDEHPATASLLAEYDELAAFRTDDGEGFFAKDVAARFITSCEELDLAVIEMEAVFIRNGDVETIEDRDLEVQEQPSMTWSDFRSFANHAAQAALAAWPDDDGDEGMVIAFVFQQPDGEAIVA